MRKITKLILCVFPLGLLVAYFLGALEPFLYFSYCSKPVTYKVSQVDPNFKVSTAVLKQNLDRAASVWNLAYGKPLVVYSDVSPLSVNLIYDERQRNLTKLYQSRDVVKSQSAQVESTVNEYESNAADLQSRVTKLNKEISDWNKKGGISKVDYNSLTQQIEAVKSEIVKLNLQRQDAEEKILEYNKLIDQYNLQVSQYTDVLKNTPEEGIYDPEASTINIYFYDSEEQFVHTSVHEFGHAIGIDHAISKDSIMYPISNSSSQLSNEDLGLLKEYCQRRSVIHELVNRSHDIISKLNLTLVNAGR